MSILFVVFCYFRIKYIQFFSSFFSLSITLSARMQPHYFWTFIIDRIALSYRHWSIYSWIDFASFALAFRWACVHLFMLRQSVSCFMVRMIYARERQRVRVSVRKTNDRWEHVQNIWTFGNVLHFVTLTPPPPPPHFSLLHSYVHDLIQNLFNNKKFGVSSWILSDTGNYPWNICERGNGLWIYMDQITLSYWYRFSNNLFIIHFLEFFFGGGFFAQKEFSGKKYEIIYFGLGLMFHHLEFEATVHEYEIVVQYLVLHIQIREKE